MRNLHQNQAGAVAIELVAVVPVMLLILLGVADLGFLTVRSASLEAAARAGAEYARLDSQAAATIQAKVTGYASFSPAVSASVARTCECDDGSHPPSGVGPSFCFNSANDAAACASGPTHVYVAVSATQDFTPVTPLSSVIFPSTLSTTVTMRVQ